MGTHRTHRWYREIAVVSTAQLAEYLGTTCYTWTGSVLQYNNVSLKEVSVIGVGSVFRLMVAGQSPIAKKASEARPADPLRELSAALGLPTVRASAATVLPSADPADVIHGSLMAPIKGRGMAHIKW